MESVSEFALLVGCLLVVAGLFFEDWITVFRVSGEVAVIVGVAIEGLADGGIFLAAGKLRMIQDAELEKMRVETAEANQRAAEANEKAESERLERLKLEDKLAWRSLTAEQQEELIDKLEPFAGQRIDIFTTSGQAEIMYLANMLQVVFLEAGWIPPSMYQGATFLFPVPGIMVEYDAKDGPAVRAASAIKDELMKLGLTAWLVPNLPDGTVKQYLALSDGPPNASVRITIGDKV